jgi:S-layer protein
VIANLIAADLTTLNISGSGALTLTQNTLGGALTTAITSTSTGAVTLGVALNNATAYTGGEGVDTIIVGATTAAINTGGGNDRVTMSLEVGEDGSVDGGTGTNTLVMTAVNAAARTANGDFADGISNFQRLEIGQAAAATAINLANLDDINHVTLAGTDATARAISFTGVSSGVTGVFTAGHNAGSITTFTLATDGAADVANIEITSAANINIQGLTLTGFETVNFTATESGALTNNVDTATVALTNANATTITVAGNANLALTHAGTALRSLDASANTRGGVTYTTAALTGASTLTGGAGVNTINAAQAVAAVTITGGALADTLTGSATRSSTLNGGGGNDLLTGGAAADVINGGEGTDTFVFSSAGIVQQAGSGNTMGAVINLSANAISAGDVFTATGGGNVGRFLSGTQTSVASNTATYLFSNESNTNASVVDTLSSIENVTGTNLRDYIVGSDAANVIRGDAGADVLTGGAGADTFVFDAAAAGTFAGNASIFGSNVITDFTAGAGGDVFAFLGADVGNADVALTSSIVNIAGTTGPLNELVIVNEAFANTAAAVAAIQAVTSPTGTLFAVFITDTDTAVGGNQSFTQIIYDADPNTPGGEIVVATLSNITTLVGHNTLTVENFALFA